MKTVVMPMSKNSHALEFLRKILFYQNNYLILISAFLLGASNVAGANLPFGAVFYAAALKFAGAKLLVAAAVIFGTAMHGSLEQVYINAACMLVFSVLCIPVKDSGSRINIKAAGLLFVSVLVPQMMLAGLRGFLLYDILKGVFSAFIAFVAYFIFRFSIPVMAGITKKILLTGEEAISIAITVVLVVSGTGIIQIFGFSIRNILCSVLLMIFSFKCGAGVGAASGVAIGLITSISTQTTPAITGAYALCGMMAGILGNLGKAGSALGFVMGNMILAAYLNGAAETMFYLREIIIAAVVFFIIPNRLISRITASFSRDSILSADSKGYSNRIRNITVEKLEKFSKSFLELSKTFDEITETRMPSGKQDISVLFDRVADRICRDCSLCMYCWERNFYDTYQIIFKIVETLEAKGRVEEADIPEYFLDKCARINDFVLAVNNMYELFRMGIVWKSKLSESRGVISRQFEGMSRVIAGLANEINTDVSFISSLEQEITAVLQHAGIKVKEVIAYKNNWGKFEVHILHSACGGARSCISVLERTVSEAVGRKMIRENENCCKDRDGSCSLKFVEAENLKLATGIARLAKYGSTVSGDSFTFLNNGNGKYTLALSDGMGSGHRAAAQSKATVNMLESFIDAGFDKDMAVSLINSVLVLKSGEESSCTIDMSIIDLFNGEVEFVKIGAAPTYIKKNGKVDMIRSASLPAGILPGIDAELAHRCVEGGDMIIMVTDGIIDSLCGDESGDRQLIKLLQEQNSLNPQQIADSILEEANRCCDGKPCDDLTVLVAKVWEKPG